MIRKLIPALFIAVIFLNPIYPVFAQESTSSTIKRDTVKQKVEERKEKVASREAMLKEKLQKFRDKKKAAVVERINTNLEQMNARRTQQMLSMLNKMSDILTRLETRISESKDATKDFTQARSEITTAKTAISVAKSSVEAQMKKEYTVTVTSETKSKDDVTLARNGLSNDLKVSHDLVVAARQAVAKAISTTVSTVKGGASNGK